MQPARQNRAQEFPPEIPQGSQRSDATPIVPPSVCEECPGNRTLHQREGNASPLRAIPLHIPRLTRCATHCVFKSIVRNPACITRTTRDSGQRSIGHAGAVAHSPAKPLPGGRQTRRSPERSGPPLPAQEFPSGNSACIEAGPQPRTGVPSAATALGWGPTGAASRKWAPPPPARTVRLEYRVDTETLRRRVATRLELNEIGRVALTTRSTDRRFTHCSGHPRRP